MATAFVLGPQGYTGTLVLRVCMGQFDLVLAHDSKGTRSQGEGPQVCRKVVRACSQPQGMLLHFETRRSGVGECARPGEVPSQPRGGLCVRVPHLRLLFRSGGRRRGGGEFIVPHPSSSFSCSFWLILRIVTDKDRDLSVGVVDWRARDRQVASAVLAWTDLPGLSTFYFGKRVSGNAHNDRKVMDLDRHKWG
jgi:hypothetical protein